MRFTLVFLIILAKRLSTVQGLGTIRDDSPLAKRYCLNDVIQTLADPITSLHPFLHQAPISTAYSSVPHCLQRAQ